MKISSRFLIGAIALIGEAAVLDSCRDYYPDTSYLYNYSQYNNFRAITVNNPCDDHFMSIYYDQPFSEEGGVCAKEYLGGKGPFSMTLNVPSHVKQLYVVDNGVLTVHPVGDLEVGAKTRGLEYTQGELDALYNHVTSVYLPTAKYNVTGDDLFKCTDIRLEREGDDLNREIESFNISLIDLMKTGEKTNFHGNLFAYVYPKDAQHHLKIDNPDLHFFAAKLDDTDTFAKHIEKVDNKVGRDEDDRIFCELEEIPYTKLVDMGSKVSKKNYSGGITADQIKTDYGFWPLLYSRKYGNAHIIIQIPAEYEGYNLGFVYLGGQNLRFTTPALNIGFPGPADSQYGQYPAKGNYLGFTLQYDLAKINGNTIPGYSGNFVLDRHVANGFIWHFYYEYDGVVKQYDVLGMDNQYPFNKQNFYDADYADYKVLISTDPEYLKPVEELLPPIHTPFTLEEGYYLFEDTYPNEGDYDYNDVIVQYEWRHYPEDDQHRKNVNRVNCTLEGYACEYTNTFGFINIQNKEHHPIFEKIKGRMNVATSPEEFIDLEADNTIDVEYEFVGNKDNIKPYLSNYKGEIYKEETGDYQGPFILTIPEILDKDEDEFRWTIEGARLSDAYYTITGDGWYLPTNIKDETKLMKRHNTIGGN